MKNVYGAVLAAICCICFQGCNENETVPTTEIRSFYPAVGAVGGTILISGTGFDKNAEENVVLINDIQAEVLQASSTRLIVKIPDATTGKISVEAEGRTAESSVDFEIVEASGSWKEMSDFPSNPSDFRTESLVISNDEFAFVGLGAGSFGIQLKDFWKFDPVTDSWTQLSDFPGEVTMVRSSFLLDNKVYVFVDLTFDTEIVTDFWSYDIEQDTWTEIQTDLQPSEGSDYFVYVSAPYQSKGIIGFRHNNFDGSESFVFRVYDPVNSSWTNSDVEFPIDNEGQYTFAIVTTTEALYKIATENESNSHGYFLSVSKFDYATGQSSIENIPEAPFRTGNGFTASSNGNLYFGLGSYNDFWVDDGSQSIFYYNNVSGYSTETDSWFIAAPAPFFANGDKSWWRTVPSFELNGKCYVIFGDNENGHSNKVFEFTP